MKVLRSSREDIKKKKKKLSMRPMPDITVLRRLWRELQRREGREKEKKRKRRRQRSLQMIDVEYNHDG